MSNWKDSLKYDPIPALRKTDNKAIHYFIARDLLREDVGSIMQLYELPPAIKILKKLSMSNFHFNSHKVKKLL